MQHRLPASHASATALASAGLLAVLLAAPCQAQPPVAEAEPRAPVENPPPLVAASPYPARFAVTGLSTHDAGSFATAGDEPDWRSPPMESEPHILVRLKELDELPLVTLWENPGASVFIGLDEDGRPGIHLRQKEDD